MVYRTGDANYNTCKYMVDPIAGQGTHTTITAAVTVAAPGDTIYIRPGIYTEDFSLPVGVNLLGSGFIGGAAFATVIVGKITDGGQSVNSTITGLSLQTNSDYIIEMTGAITAIIFNNCFINASNHAAFTGNGNTQSVYLFDCIGDLGSNTVFYDGDLNIFINYCEFTNGGGSIVPSITTGSQVLRYSEFFFPFTTASGGTIDAIECIFDVHTHSVLCVQTFGGGVSSFDNCSFFSGSAAAVSSDGATTINIFNSTIGSSNTNPITGVGTVNFGGIDFSDTGSGIDTFAQQPFPYQVKLGGTGDATLTANCLMIGQGTNPVTLTTVGNAGQLLQSSGTGVDPTWTTATYPATATNTGDVLTADGTNWVSLPPTPAPFPWTDVTGTTQLAAINNGYVADNATVVTITLPTTAPFGSIVHVVGKGTGGWVLQADTGQIINFGNAQTATTGNLTSTNQYDAVQVLCTVADSVWTVSGIAQGALVVN